MYKSHSWSLHLCQSFLRALPHRVLPSCAEKEGFKLIEMLLLRPNMLHHRSLLRNNDKNHGEQKSENFRFPFGVFGDFICWGESEWRVSARTHPHQLIFISTPGAQYTPLKTCWFDKYWTLPLNVICLFEFYLIFHLRFDYVCYVWNFAISMGLSENHIFGVVFGVRSVTPKNFPT